MPVRYDGNYQLSTFNYQLKFGAVLVSTGVVRLDKRAVAPDHDKTGKQLKLTDNNSFAMAA